jgi:hypothetical protein
LKCLEEKELFVSEGVYQLKTLSESQKKIIRKFMFSKDFGMIGNFIKFFYNVNVTKDDLETVFKIEDIDVLETNVILEK